MKTHRVIYHCDASVVETIKDSYMGIYVCNLSQDKGLGWRSTVLPHSCLNTIYTEADVMALKNVVGGIVHDTPHLPLLYLHEYIFNLCVAVYAFECVFMEFLF